MKFTGIPSSSPDDFSAQASSREAMPGDGERSHNEVFNFVRVQALDKLAQIPAQRNRTGPISLRVYKGLCKRSPHLTGRTKWRSKEKFWTN
jgi:hypothetical protein